MLFNWPFVTTANLNPARADSSSNAHTNVPTTMDVSLAGTIWDQATRERHQTALQVLGSSLSSCPWQLSALGRLGRLLQPPNRTKRWPWTPWYGVVREAMDRVTAFFGFYPVWRRDIKSPLLRWACSLELVPPRASRCFARFSFARKLQTCKYSFSLAIVAW